MRSVVVLPHPEGPRSTTNSPSWMESDTSLTASTVSNFLLRFSKSNSPNGCSPRLLPAIRELWGREREELGSFPGPLIIRVSPPGINLLRAIHGAAVHPPLCDMPRPLRAGKHSVRTIPSGPREIMRQFTLEFGEVARDHRHVEASEYRLLWLMVEQESEGCLKAALRRMVPARQPVAHFTRHRDVVTSLAPSLAKDHFEIERATLAHAPDLA